MNRKERYCEECGRLCKMRGLVKIPTGHNICKRCSRRNGSLSSYRSAEDSVWKSRKRRRAFSSQEEKILWNLYEKKKLSYIEMKRRIQELKEAVKKNNDASWRKQQSEKPSFKEKFEEMVKVHSK